jgi:hypothetical protein
VLKRGNNATLTLTIDSYTLAGDAMLAIGYGFSEGMTLMIKADSTLTVATGADSGLVVWAHPVEKPGVVGAAGHSIVVTPPSHIALGTARGGSHDAAHPANTTSLPRNFSNTDGTKTT